MDYVDSTDVLVKVGYRRIQIWRENGHLETIMYPNMCLTWKRTFLQQLTTHVPYIMLCEHNKSLFSNIFTLFLEDLALCMV